MAKKYLPKNLGRQTHFLGDSFFFSLYTLRINGRESADSDKASRSKWDERVPGHSGDSGLCIHTVFLFRYPVGKGMNAMGYEKKKSAIGPFGMELVQSPMQ